MNYQVIIQPAAFQEIETSYRWMCDNAIVVSWCTFMSELSLKVHAFWDEEAQVWTASSEDVPGLVTEASSLEDLEQKLMIMVPELLELNQVISGDSGQEISIDLISQRISKILVNV